MGCVKTEVDSDKHICHENCDHIEDLQANLPTSAAKNQSLKGIWKDAGFEKIMNLEDEIYKMRQELQDSILQRVL